MTSRWNVGSFSARALEEKPVYLKGVEVVCSLAQDFGLDKEFAPYLYGMYEKKSRCFHNCKPRGC